MRFLRRFSLSPLCLKSRPRQALAICLFGITLASSSPVHAAREEPAVPDFTKGEKIGKKHDWNLGPIGARGWMWGWKLQTTKARQIYVTQVAATSPADGVLAVGDVILGVSDQPFTDDARIVFGKAIGVAEAADGKLSLIRWRAGQTATVTIQLPTLGHYAATSPFECQKSKAILDAGCAHIAKRMKRDLALTGQRKWRGSNGSFRYSDQEIIDAVDALALLSVDQPEYRELVQHYAASVAPADLELGLSDGSNSLSWGWGYVNLFLCEYHLLTGDKSVLPAIRKYATALAEAQSFIGTWGHTGALPEFNGGKLHGSLKGYGALNQAGLICHLALVLSQKCGVTNDEVEKAVEQANRFIGFYEGKGAIPYGDHFPESSRHDDNGKNSIAAVLFDLQGETKKTRFFSWMSVASYGEREVGHTGNYFSLLWGPLGAARVGDAAAAAFMERQRWFYDLNRAWDGSFTYQGGANSSAGEHSYRGWDSTSAFMLSYAMPLKKLSITGKGARQENLLSGPSLEVVLAAGEGFTPWDKGAGIYDEKTEEALLRDLKSWSPAVRTRAAQALARKPGAEGNVAKFIEMLESPNLFTQYGGCQGLIAMKARGAAAVPALEKVLGAKDSWLKMLAVSALANIGEAAKSAVPALLELVMTQDAADPHGMTQRYLAFGLFDARSAFGSRGLLEKSLDGVDRKLLYQVVEKILSNADGRARGTLASVYKGLTFEELQPIFPAILEAIKTPSPSGVMFASEVRLRGLELLSKHRVKEGMELCFHVLDIHKWGKNGRINKCLDALAAYGGAAKPVLPQLRKLEKDLSRHREARMLKSHLLKTRTLIKSIESATEVPKLRSIQ